MNNDTTTIQNRYQIIVNGPEDQLIAIHSQCGKPAQGKLQKQTAMDWYRSESASTNLEILRSVVGDTFSCNSKTSAREMRGSRQTQFVDSPKDALPFQEQFVSVRDAAMTYIATARQKLSESMHGKEWSCHPSGDATVLDVSTEDYSLTITANASQLIFVRFSESRGTHQDTLLSLQFSKGSRSKYLSAFNDFLQMHQDKCGTQ